MNVLLCTIYQCIEIELWGFWMLLGSRGRVHKLGFLQSFFMQILNLLIKNNLNGNTENSKRILKYCIKVFTVREEEKLVHP